MAVKDRWSPSRKAAHTPKAMLITLSFGGMKRTRRNMARMLAIVASMPALPTALRPILLPRLSSGLPRYLRSR
ncbi:hypothetical protein D3C80_1798480 [compost metagenome]